MGHCVESEGGSRFNSERLVHIQKFCAECQDVVMLRPRGLRLALSIFRLYFQRCRSRVPCGDCWCRCVFSERQRLPQNIVFSFSFPPFIAFPLLGRRLLSICISRFNYSSVRSIFNCSVTTTTATKTTATTTVVTVCLSRVSTSDVRSRQL